MRKIAHHVVVWFGLFGLHRVVVLHFPKNSLFSTFISWSKAGNENWKLKIISLHLRINQYFDCIFCSSTSFHFILIQYRHYVIKTHTNIYHHSKWMDGWMKIESKKRWWCHYRISHSFVFFSWKMFKTSKETWNQNSRYLVIKIKNFKILSEWRFLHFCKN